ANGGTEVSVGEGVYPTLSAVGRVRRTEGLPGESLADDGEKRIGAGSRLVRGEEAPGSRANAEELEVVPEDRVGAGLRGTAVTRGEVDAYVVEHREAVEERRGLADLQSRRTRDADLAAVRGGELQIRSSPGAADSRQRSEQELVDDREHDPGRAEARAQREGDEDGEARLPPERADDVLRVDHRAPVES